MQSTGLNTGNKVHAKAVAAQLIQSMRMQALSRWIVRDGTKGTAAVSRLPQLGVQAQSCRLLNAL